MVALLAAGALGVVDAAGHGNLAREAQSGQFYTRAVLQATVQPLPVLSVGGLHPAIIAGHKVGSGQPNAGQPGGASAGNPGDHGPGDQGSGPGDQGNGNPGGPQGPGDQGNGPGDQGNGPGDPQGPGDQGNGPGDQGNGPGDQGSGPGDQGNGNAGGAQAPGDQGSGPGDQGNGNAGQGNPTGPGDRGPGNSGQSGGSGGLGDQGNGGGGNGPGDGSGGQAGPGDSHHGKDWHGPRGPGGSGQAGGGVPTPVPTPPPVTIPTPSSGQTNPPPSTGSGTPTTPTTTPTPPTSGKGGGKPHSGHRRHSTGTGTGASFRVQPAGATAAGHAGSATAATGSRRLVLPSFLTPITSGTAAAAATGTAGAARGHASRPAHGASTAAPAPHTVFQTLVEQIPVAHFISEVPESVWLIIVGSLLLTGLATGTAIFFGRRARHQAGQIARVAAAALTDPLTGLLNRRGFTEAVERELARSTRYARPFVLAYIDVRGLKGINDTEGHLAGDQLLRGVASVLTASARAHDVIGRLGGDEFGLLLPEQSGVDAQVVAGRIAEQVAVTRDALGFQAHWDLTIGTAAFPEDGTRTEELIAVADRRLYEQRGIALVGSR